MPFCCLDRFATLCGEYMKIGVCGRRRLMIFALERHDLPLIQGSIFVITAIYCCANLVADLLYAFFNPKIRYGNVAG